jgi:hypothetical protein
VGRRQCVVPSSVHLPSVATPKPCITRTCRHASSLSYCIRTVFLFLCSWYPRCACYVDVLMNCLGSVSRMCSKNEVDSEPKQRYDQLETPGLAAPQRTMIACKRRHQRPAQNTLARNLAAMPQDGMDQNRNMMVQHGSFFVCSHLHPTGKPRERIITRMGIQPHQQGVCV